METTVGSRNKKPSAAPAPETNPAAAVAARFWPEIASASPAIRKKMASAPCTATEAISLPLARTCSTRPSTSWPPASW